MAIKEKQMDLIEKAKALKIYIAWMIVNYLF
ncbi:hypothetical protein PTH_0767 [Pelotomaculum thermopropionicum SI]|uniref:Uncharacterized protein n=1 Tax=Pelotomaculum thermopropionicum (strain DSM 13744 / JCM 10971 / SI) TaxID=370438 RepID=A5D471_PELTS|nr:hypothetical protein PTH_0767 [Pelotomaculum thermopropionicum SI]